MPTVVYDTLGLAETREILTGQVIRMLALDKRKAAQMRRHLGSCTIMMVLNFRDSLLGYTPKLFP